MAMFGGLKPRTTPGATPYYPTPEEQMAAIPNQPAGLGQPQQRRGIFGTMLLADQRGTQGGSILAQELAALPGRADGPFVTSGTYSTPPIAPTAAEREANDRAPMIGWGETLDRGGGMRLPDIGSGLPDVSTLPTRKPKFFGRGGLGWDIVGSLGDAFAAAGGGQAIYWPQKLAQQKHQRDLMERTLQFQRQRQAERDEWTWRENYKRAHPDDQFTQYLTAAGIDPSSPRGRELYRQRAESMAAPPLMAVDGFDAQGNPTKTFMPRTGFTGGAAPAPAGPAVGTVKNGFRFAGGNPNDRSSWVPVGGASPGGGATFR